MFVRISDISFQNTALFLEHAIGVAEHYGFVPDNAAQKENTTIIPQGRKTRVPARSISFARPDERGIISMVHTCADLGLGTVHTPIFIWRKGKKVRTGSTRFSNLELHIVGVPSPVAEAVLIVVANAIIRDAGIESLTTYLNSLGTIESSGRFLRDLSTYLRKHLGDLSASARIEAAQNPLNVLAQLAEKKDPLLDRAPASMEYLNEEERRHFWDVLEFLEAAEVYYEFDHSILGSRDCWEHTVFDVCTRNEDGKITPLARGGRYDPLIRKCVGETGSGAFVSILCEEKGRTKPKPPDTGAPTIYFAHLGDEAKRKSIAVLELLREAQIRTHQSLAHNLLADQMRIAKQRGVKHLLIMGHKEASENAVLVRNTRTNAQEPVPIPQLAGYLKRRKIGAVS